MTPNEAAHVLAVFEKADDYETLMWRVDLKPYYVPDIKLFAGCNDFFHYATADAEEITPDDLELLEQCFADLKKVDSTEYVGELFAARKRRLRPLDVTRNGMGESLRALFDAAGSEEGREEADRRDESFWLHVGHKLRTQAGEIP